jgi:hypothetical protein
MKLENKSATSTERNSKEHIYLTSELDGNITAILLSAM